MSPFRLRDRSVWIVLPHGTCPRWLTGLWEEGCDLACLEKNIVSNTLHVGCWCGYTEQHPCMCLKSLLPSLISGPYAHPSLHPESFWRFFSQSCSNLFVKFHNPLSHREALTILPINSLRESSVGAKALISLPRNSLIHYPGGSRDLRPFNHPVI